MQPAPGIPTAEAAARLGVRRSRVHDLINGGQLEAFKIGSRFLVDPASLERRLNADPPVGRPLAPANAWLLLALASSDAGMQSTCAQHRSPAERSRMRSRLKREGVLAGASRLRRRAVVHRLRADPDDVELIGEAQSLVRTGVSAARACDFDIVAPDVLEAYIRAEHLPGLQKQYALEPSPRPNVILRAVEGPWPFPRGMRVTPEIIAAADLLDADDARARRAGREALERLGVA